MCFSSSPHPPPACSPWMMFASINIKKNLFHIDIWFDFFEYIFSHLQRLELGAHGLKGFLGDVTIGAVGRGKHHHLPTHFMKKDINLLWLHILIKMGSFQFWVIPPVKESPCFLGPDPETFLLPSACLPGTSSDSSCCSSRRKRLFSQ